MSTIPGKVLKNRRKKTSLEDPVEKLPPNRFSEKQAARRSPGSNPMEPGVGFPSQSLPFMDLNDSWWSTIRENRRKKTNPVLEKQASPEPGVKTRWSPQCVFHPKVGHSLILTIPGESLGMVISFGGFEVVRNQRQAKGLKWKSSVARSAQCSRRGGKNTKVRNYRPLGSLHRKSCKKVVKMDEKIQVSKSQLENYRPIDGIAF